MRLTRHHLRTSALTAVFALAMPLYANADLLPPPSDLGKSMGEFSGAGEYSTVLSASGNLNQTGADQGTKNGTSGKGPGRMNGGGFGSGKGFGAVASVASGSPVNNGSVVNGVSVNNTPTRGGPGDNLVSTPSGAGAGQSFVMRDGIKPKPSFTPGRIGSTHVQTGSLTDSLFGGEGGFNPNNNQQGEEGSVDDRLQAWAEVKIHENPGNNGQACFGFSNGLNRSGCIDSGEGGSGPVGSGSQFPHENDNNTQSDWIESIDLGLSSDNNDVDQILITNQVEPSIALVAIPEPGTLLLMGAGLLFLQTMRRRKPRPATAYTHR